MGCGIIDVGSADGGLAEVHIEVCLTPHQGTNDTCVQDRIMIKIKGKMASIMIGEHN